MAGGACGIGAMLLDQLADGDRTGGVGFDGWNIGWWGLTGHSEDTFDDPSASEDG